MSLSVPAAFRSAALAAQTNGQALTFVTIAHDSGEIASPFRYVNDMDDVVKDGFTYSAMPFTVILPSTGDDIGDASLTIDAVDQDVITAVRTMTVRASVSVAVALATDLTHSLALGTFEWKDIAYNMAQVSGTLAYADKLDVMVPALCMTPFNVPGNF